MRKEKIELRPRYHSKSRPHPTGQLSNRKAQEHCCTICRHPEREEIERKVISGWQMCDIQKAHPWAKGHSIIQNHMRAIGLWGERQSASIIDRKEVLERIIKHGLPVLEDGKVYPRDMIEAIKALNELEDKKKTHEVWRFIDQIRNKPDEQGNQKNTERIATIHQRSTE